MGRELKRVPLDFELDPPKGDGYQLWETTSEGSPISPVFKTIEALAKYCETECTVYGSDKLSYDEWLKTFKNWRY